MFFSIEFPPQTKPTLPPAKSPGPEGIPTRYPWPEIAGAPTPVFGPQTMRTPGFEPTPTWQEQLPTTSLISPIVRIRY